MNLQEALGTRQKYKKPRVGRGGKRGTYSGRGVKGQKARAGHRIRPAERDFIQRLPKLRGHKNKALTPKPAVVNVGTLEKAVKGDIVSRDTLKEKKMLTIRRKQVIKILGKGEVSKSFTIKGLKVSESARKKIEAAGGKIEV